MIAVELLYQLVKAAIVGIPGDDSNNGVEVIKHFDWWNANVAQDGVQTPYPTPAVFFELNFIDWLPSTRGAVKNKSTGLPEQQGVGQFTLHVIHKKINSSAVDASEVQHMAEVAEVYKAVHFLGQDQPFLEGGIQRVRDNGVLTHNVLRDWPLSFEFNLFECALADEDIIELFPWLANIIINSTRPYLLPVGIQTPTLASSGILASDGILSSS